MHHPEVKAIRPIGILFPKKVHDAKLKKSRPENNSPGRHRVFFKKPYLTRLRALSARLLAAFIL